MLQSKASNYIRLYLKLQRINTKAAWVLPTFTITILLAPYAALPYLLVSLSKIIVCFGLFCFFFPKEHAISTNKSSREWGAAQRPIWSYIKVIRKGTGLFAQQPHPFCKHVRVGSGKGALLGGFCCLLSCKKLWSEISSVIFSTPVA